MAAKQPQPGDGFTSQIAGMSKAQLYEIMSQMKILIEQNEEQAREILVDNPLLARALFQAQIMLGMVKPPKEKLNIQQALSQSQSAQVRQQPNVQSGQSGQSLPTQSVQQGQASSSQPAIPARQQHPDQPSISLPSSSLPPLAFQPQGTPSDPLHSAQQARGFLNAQVPSVSPPQSSQIHNLPSSAPYYPVLPSHMPMVSGQTQQSLQAPGIFNQPLQPPLPQQPRPPSMQPFSQQLHLHMPHAPSFQPSNAPQQLLSQPMFHSISNPPSSFPQGQPPLPSQPPLQQLYQGGLHFGPDYSNPGGITMHPERGAPWLPEKATHAVQLPGPSPLVSGDMATATGGQPPRPPPLTPEMENALLQQVMSLTPEQINLLPPEQRQQVLQLQEMLR